MTKKTNRKIKLFNKIISENIHLVKKKKVSSIEPFVYQVAPASDLFACASPADY